MNAREEVRTVCFEPLKVFESTPAAHRLYKPHSTSRPKARVQGSRDVDANRVARTRHIVRASTCCTSCFAARFIYSALYTASCGCYTPYMSSWSSSSSYYECYYKKNHTRTVQFTNARLLPYRKRKYIHAYGEDNKTTPERARCSSYINIP